MAALFIGLSAGIVCFTATMLIKQRLRIDDSLDVFPVHGVGGMLGTFFAGIFVAAQFGGAGLADGMTIASQVGVQIVGILATAGWTAVVTFLILKLVSKFVELRVNDEEETTGLDLVSHDEVGYNL
jgi:Amt family ammonium transporter